MPALTAQSIARGFLICLLALAVLSFRVPVAEDTSVAQADVSAHDHHGHSHDDEDVTSTQSSHNHDRSHAGDHSHDAPAAAIWIGFRFASLKDLGLGTPADPVASRLIPPGERPPQQA